MRHGDSAVQIFLLNNDFSLPKQTFSEWTSFFTALTRDWANGKWLANYKVIFLDMTSGRPERLKMVFPCFADSAAKSTEFCTNLKISSFFGDQAFCRDRTCTWNFLKSSSLLFSCWFLFNTNVPKKFLLKLGLWTPEFQAYYGSDIKIGTGGFFWHGWTSSISYIRIYSCCLITLLLFSSWSLLFSSWLFSLFAPSKLGFLPTPTSWIKEMVKSSSVWRTNVSMVSPMTLSRDKIVTQK